MNAPREVINGKTYAFGTLSASKAIPIGVEIGPIFMRAMAEAGSMGAETAQAIQEASASDGQTVPKSTIGAMVNALRVTSRVNALMMEEISPVDYVDHRGKPHLGLISIMNTMFETVTMITGAKTAPVSLDATFTGNLFAAKEVLMQAIKVNFHDFFPASPTDSQSGTNPGA